MDHYQRLGVTRDASTRQIRDAYRRAAREAHPDRAGAASATAMAEINEAWRVLGDPARRKAYDDSTHAAASRSGGASGAGERGGATGPVRPAVPVPRPTPSGVPWKFLFGVAAVASAALIVGYAVTDPPAPAAPDNILRPGDCVVIGPNLDASEVACSDPHDAVVQILVPFDADCPNATEAYRDRQGMGLACVVRRLP